MACGIIILFLFVSSINSLANKKSNKKQESSSMVSVTDYASAVENKLVDLICANFYRLCITAFLFNFSAYFLWTVIPLKANELGASSMELAIIQAVSYGLGALFSPIAGKLADKINPYLLFRIADLFFIAFVI